MRLPEFPYLICHEGKHGTRYFLATDERTYHAAIMACFHCIRQYDGFYNTDDLPGDQLEYFKAAMEGDPQSALWLMEIRSDYEYESVWGECLGSPSKDLDRVGVHLCDYCNKWKVTTELRSVPGCVATSTLPSRICKPCDPLEKNNG